MRLIVAAGNLRQVDGQNVRLILFPRAVPQLGLRQVVQAGRLEQA